MAVVEQAEMAALIRETRQLLRLAQTEFAAKLGVSFHSVNCWKNGRTRPISLTLKQIETLLHPMGEQGEDLLTKYFSNQD
ncbi:helix-turn-helix transcriptional regulator [Microcoleus sp. FACHB-53]|nr:helix-turn-helix transcriptional regulator [Microcoleus sp. FACHB-53]